MRIRKLIFRDFRSFRERTFDFSDPLTGEVRPVTVLAGTNGTGKTTILDVISQLLTFVIEPEPYRYGPIVSNMLRTSEDPEREKGFIWLTLELDPTELGRSPDSAKPEDLHIMIGGLELARKEGYDSRRTNPNVVYRFVAYKQSLRDKYRRRSKIADELANAVRTMQKEGSLCGGFLYFPHDRQLRATLGGSVEPPPEERQWVFRFSSSDRWQGSLEQLWVWQNYLDLEQGSSERNNLRSFVDTVEAVLGEDRRIIVSGGRVLVPAPQGKDGGKATVRLDQLPSGEQQVLLLFGELARRRRKGAVVAIDEPEISLHPTLQRQVVHQLRKFAREWDMQLILATHSLEVLRAVHESERVILDQLEEPSIAPEATR